MKSIFAFDFSINKPAMCAFINNKFYFYTWPLNIDKKSYEILNNCDVNIINRDLSSIDKKKYDSHSLVLEHIKRSIQLVDLIISDIKELISKNNIDINDIIISSEGLSYGSNGDATLNLASYKQVFLNEIYKLGITNIKTYSPITIKSVAGCSKKNLLGKDKMIQAILTIDDIEHNFIKTIKYNQDALKKKTSFVMTVDDLVDAFWCLQTTIVKENLNI